MGDAQRDATRRRAKLVSRSRRPMEALVPALALALAAMRARTMAAVADAFIAEIGSDENLCPDGMRTFQALQFSCIGTPEIQISELASFSWHPQRGRKSP